MTECLPASRETLWRTGRRGRERVLALHDVACEAAAWLTCLQKVRRGTNLRSE
jgi:hypothetical protein